jgi:hypothetical protein
VTADLDPRDLLVLRYERLDRRCQAEGVERRRPQLGDQPAQLDDLLVDLLDRGLSRLPQRLG